MECVLATLCIFFFILLTYALIQGYNLQKHHKFNCRTIYIPEDIDLETAFKSIENKDKNKLKKRARQLGATKEFINSITDIELKVFIIQTSISNEHILFKELEEEIKMRDEINSEIIEEISIVQLNPEITIQELYDDFTE
jgi:hypothetical protein